MVKDAWLAIMIPAENDKKNIVKETGLKNKF